MLIATILLTYSFERAEHGANSWGERNATRVRASRVKQNEVRAIIAKSKKQNSKSK